MVRLFKFLAMLIAEKFWGEVRIKFKDGRTIQISVERDYLMDTLPQPDTCPRHPGQPCTSQALDAAMRAAMNGV